MKPYYKQGGFFDRLERLSKLIDYYIDVYGFLYLVPGFRRISVLNSYLEDSKYALEEAIADVEHYKRLYNKQKYWWMSAK